ncbi:hypothetical protein [Polymorphospora rubra]|uniref:Ribosomal protein L7/L12 C-terminal domain-containing protein n=1 Tax=Polymorphospora rubra TaxID=338584 RepID=A0A810MUZ3_9ACTN|nr:hypothetical protein [Polymorphospora rubra]BCJ63245.1 hypothetical protein Prubr_02660 [Polymorphospora rubra]
MEWFGALVAIVVVVVLVIGVIVFVAARRRPGADLVGSALAERARYGAGPAGVVAGPEGVEGLDRLDATDRALVADILELLGRNRKIQAIKVLRTRRPMGLAEAKQVVEQIGAGRVPARWPGQPPRLPEVADRSVVDRATDLKRQGRLIDAVKLVRAETGLSLREAKEMVDVL